MPAVLWLLLAAPFIELWFIIRVGSSLGALNTIALLIFAGIAGMALLRRQSLSAMLRLDQRLQQGELPADEILGGFLLAFAAILLLIPGFLSDLLALPLLLPPLRRWLVRRYLGSRHYRAHYFRTSKPFQQRPGAPHDIIEGEWRREDDPRLR